MRRVSLFFLFVAVTGLLATAASAYNLEVGGVGKNYSSYTGAGNATVVINGSSITSITGTFNFALGPDFHLWDPGYNGAGGYNLYNESLGAFGKPHKFQSGNNQFTFTLSSAVDVPVYDNGHAQRPDALWAITQQNLSNTHIYGQSSSLSVAGDGYLSGTLQSTGLFNWYGTNWLDTTMASEYYNSVYGLSGQLNLTSTVGGVKTYSGTLTLTNDASAVPEPMSIMLGMMGLASVAGLKRFKK